ncbi:1099_t:CDS:2, partial [Ambispora leptoticha]
MESHDSNNNIVTLNNSNLNTNSGIINTTNSEKEQELNKISCQVLQQCIDLLSSLPSNETYTWKSDFVPKSTIGKHVRHMIDHFRLLLLKNESNNSIKENNKDLYERGTIINNSNIGIDNSDIIWTVNYDNRKSHESIETSPTFAAQRIKELQKRLLNDFQNKSLLSTPIQLEATVDSNPQVNQMTFLTTFGRELWFCCHHA